MSAPERSRREYARRMTRVLDHIDQHLDAPLDLQQLAALAHFSPFHFHRLFAAWVGETLGAYLQRRRLEVAARRLADAPELSVLEVALGVGFGSGEAFARAFKTHFGQTPRAWRTGSPERQAAYLAAERERARWLKRNLDQDAGSGLAEDGELLHSGRQAAAITMQVEIKILAPQRVVSMRHIGPYGPGLTDFWRERFLPWVQAAGLPLRPSYGIGLDDPHITPPERCRYDAAMQVDADFVLPPDGAASLAMLPGGRYAVARFEGRGDEIGPAWTELFRGWLPSSGLRCDDRPCFEYYGEPDCGDAVSGRVRFEICIPVVAL